MMIGQGLKTVKLFSTSLRFPCQTSNDHCPGTSSSSRSNIYPHKYSLWLMSKVYSPCSLRRRSPVLGSAIPSAGKFRTNRNLTNLAPASVGVPESTKPNPNRELRMAGDPTLFDAGGAKAVETGWCWVEQDF